MHTIISELTTVIDWIRWSCSRFREANLFYGHGTDNAWDDAIALVLGAIQFSHFDSVDAIRNATLTFSEREHIFELVQKRTKQRIPTPYLTHHAYFAGMEFYVDQRVMIPRSPLAEWIEKGFEPYIDADQIEQVLDLCTGSGCIAAAMAAYFPDASVDAVDISQDALNVAKINVEKLQLQARVHLHEGDLFEALPQTKRYDVIISNPPYVDEVEYHELPIEFSYEPQLAFTASYHGLAIVLKMLKQASDFLSEHGILVVEVGNSKPYLIECLPQVPFTWLECERGGDGIFLLTADQLKSCTQHLNLRGA